MSFSLSTERSCHRDDSAPSRHHLRLQVAVLLAASAIAAVVVGCASPEDTTRLHVERPIGPVGFGCIDRTSPPPPESTIRPRPGSWAAVRPPHDYRVVLLTAADDRATTTLATGVKLWAAEEEVRLDIVAATAPDRFVEAIVEAKDLAPDLVICAGGALVDALALVTASHLEQQFLVVGAQLPEPTLNVTAAIWRGASSRGRGVPDAASSFDPDTFTSRQVGDAIRAGVARVLHDITGIVIWLD
jgi:hypothetical protein